MATLKAIAEKHWQFPSSAPEDVKTAVDSVVACAKSHSCRNIQTSGNSLGALLSGLGPDDSSSFDAPPQMVGSILHPPRESVGSKATVTPKLKTTTTAFSPFSKSPAGTPTSRMKRKLDEAMEQFVVIKRPTPVKMVLTEHQKEVMRRKADIPALYQDLSQDTQNASQDCVILPSSPANPPKKGRFEPDEEAALDFDDIVPFKNAGKDLDSSVSILEEEKKWKVHGTIEIDDNATMQFVSETNDDVLTCSQDSDMAVRLEDEPVSAVSDKTPVTPNRRKSIVPVSKEQTVTRSRRKMSDSLVTRSGKLVKTRQSLNNQVFKSPPKVKARQRKSLPSDSNALPKGETESSEENPPTEARSPMKALARGRGSRVTLKAPPKALPKAAETKVTEEISETESSKSSEGTLSAASPSTESSVSSSDASVSSEPAPKAFTSPPPSAIRDRSRRKTTPTRKALLLFQEHSNVDRISQAVVGKSSKAAKAEQPKPSGRALRRNRSKSSIDENDPKPAEPEDPDVSETKRSPAKCPEPVVIIEKMSEIPEQEKPAPEPIVIPESDSETLTQAETTTTDSEPAEAPAANSEIAEASKPEEIGDLSIPQEGENPLTEVVIPESQDIIESSQGPEDTIPTPRSTQSPKKDETPASAKWTLRVSDTLTPLDSGKDTSSAPSTPKAVVEEKAPRRIVGENDDRSDSMPSWMHAKKIISPGKPRLIVKRISPADLVKVSQPPSEEGSGSPPPKANEATPTSSPVQSKWTRTESATPTGRSPGNFPMRTGRAAHLLGLGQAAAARSGEEIRMTLSPSQKEETTAPTAAPTAAPSAAPSAAPLAAPSAGPTTPAAVEAAAPAPSALNSTNGMSIRATLNGHVIASPRVRKRTRMGLSSRFSDGAHSKEPQTPGAEWIRKTYQPDATPEGSILKKARRTPACLDPDSPPSSKKKRVSFHDPPVSKSLNFFHTTADEYSGTVHSSDGVDEPLSGKSPALEEKKMMEPNPVKWMKPVEEDKRDSLVTMIVEETDLEMEREGRLNIEESTILRQRNYDDKGDHRLMASKEDKSKRREDGENQTNNADENRWSDGRVRKDEDRVDVARWKKLDEVDVDFGSAEEQRLRKEEEEKAQKEEEERVRREVEDKGRQEEEERIRKETEEKQLEEERLLQEAEEERLREERVQKEAEEKKRVEQERLLKEAQEKKRMKEERLREEAEERRKEEERVRKEAEERKREEEERLRQEAEEKKHLEQERLRKEEEEKKRIEEERLRKEEEERLRKEEEEERLRKEEEEKRLRKEEEEERLRKEVEDRRKEEERIRKEEEEKKCKEEERLRELAEEKKRKEEERLRKAEEKKRKGEERLRKLAEEKKRKEEEKTRVELEKLKRMEEERLEKEAEEKKRVEEERLQKEFEEMKRMEEEKLKKVAEERKRIAIELEEKRKEEERIRKEAEDMKRIEEEKLEKEAEERKRIAVELEEKRKEEERLRKEAEDMKRIEEEEEKQRKEAEERKRIAVEEEERKEAEAIKHAEKAEKLLKEEQERTRVEGENSQNEEEKSKKMRGRPKKRQGDEIRRIREEERKRKAEELEESDAQWSRKEEIRLGLLAETRPSSSMSDETSSSGSVSRGPRFDSDLSQIAAFSQGDASVTHPILFSSPGAVYPSLVGCEEPIDKIIDSLTGAAWRRNLLRKFTDARLTTIGHLAALTEEQVNRYAIRPPRKDTLVKALEKYECESGVSPKPVGISEPTTPGRDPEDNLPLSTLVEASGAVSIKPVDPVTSIPTNVLLKELTGRIGVSGILKQLCDDSEAELLGAVESYPGVRKLLPRTPFEDLVEECSARIGNITEVAACNGKLVDLVSSAVAKEAILKRTASVLVSQSNGKEILETLFKSVLNHL